MPASEALAQGRVRQRREASRRRWTRDLPTGPLAILLLFVLGTLIGPTVGLPDPLALDLRHRLEPPILFGGGLNHILGTDELGRDVLSRLLVGARVSLTLAAVSLALGAAVGACVGIVSGYAGGQLDAVLMRAADLTISYPMVLVALLLAGAFGPSFTNVVVVIVLLLWARIAVVVRSEVLGLRQRGYVELARVAGASPLRIVFEHVLPNVANTIVALACINAGLVILTEAGLSFIAAGIPPPTPSWGSMIAFGRNYLEQPWLVGCPALAIVITVYSLNSVGDWVRDRLDPRLVKL